MRKYPCVLPITLALMACDSSPTTGSNGAVQPTPSERLSEISQAYAGNAIQAKRRWGGKRLVVGGDFLSAGKNSTGGTSLILTAGPARTDSATFDVGRGRDDFVASLNNGDPLVLTCTVDPDEAGFAIQFLSCEPMKNGNSS